MENTHLPKLCMAHFTRVNQRITVQHKTKVLWEVTLCRLVISNVSKDVFTVKQSSWTA